MSKLINIQIEFNIKIMKIIILKVKSGEIIFFIIIFQFKCIKTGRKFSTEFIGINFSSKDFSSNQN